MPLVILCGTPVSGKSTRARELKDFFEKKHQKRVEIVSEDDVIRRMKLEKNPTYLDSEQEKNVRSFLKSEILRFIGTANVIILDGSNYIKGFRYELYCISKANKSTQCTVYTIRNQEDAWKANQQREKKEDNASGASKPKRKVECTAYTEEVFNALTQRFEEPNPSYRWDSPLFTVTTTDALDLEGVHKALFEVPQPTPNMSTQNPPLSPTNFVHDLDKVTQSISKQIMEAKEMNIDEVKFRAYPDCVLEARFTQLINARKLMKLRRTFLTYAKMYHSDEEPRVIGRYYIQYLNNTLTD